MEVVSSQLTFGNERGHSGEARGRREYGLKAANAIRPLQDATRSHKRRSADGRRAVRTVTALQSAALTPLGPGPGLAGLLRYARAHVNPTLARR
jgi:hypothetical protein